MVRIVYKTPHFVYNKEDNILMITSKKYLNYWLELGFEEITEKEARKLPEFKNIADLINQK